MTFDHIALGVPNLEAALNAFVEALGYRLLRTGVQYKSGRPIAMIADRDGKTKVELIETDGTQTEWLHVAYRVADVPAAYDRLLAEGFTGINPPHRLEAAKADTALLSTANALNVQIIQYDPESPDVL